MGWRWLNNGFWLIQCFSLFLFILSYTDVFEWRDVLIKVSLNFRMHLAVLQCFWPVSDELGSWRNRRRWHSDLYRTRLARRWYDSSESHAGQEHLLRLLRRRGARERRFRSVAVGRLRLGVCNWRSHSRRRRSLWANGWWRTIVHWSMLIPRHSDAWQNPAQSRMSLHTFRRPRGFNRWIRSVVFKIKANVMELQQADSSINYKLLQLFARWSNLNKCF